MGKYHERFAGLRLVIEFKYLSNTEFSRMKEKLEDFKMRKEDTIQIEGYAKSLIQENPEAHIRLFVIYCIGNTGFKIFGIWNRKIRHDFSLSWLDQDLLIVITTEWKSDYRNCRYISNKNRYSIFIITTLHKKTFGLQDVNVTIGSFDITLMNL